MKTNQAIRIQTALTSQIEKRVLVWLAERQPSWVTSDMLTLVGMTGAAIMGLGYILASKGIGWLWLSSLGLVINWFGDSLDGTLARVRNTQRPLYGYYLDHTADCINEGMMFIGAGLSPLIRLDLALIAYIIYLFLTINVSINAHLKGEFRLTYAKLGPTEFRILVILFNTALIVFRPIREFSRTFLIAGTETTLCALDMLALVIILVLSIIYLCTIITDARYYAGIDPEKPANGIPWKQRRYGK